MSTKESLFHNLGDFSTHLSIHFILDILYSTYFLMNYNENYEVKLQNTKSLEKNRSSNNFIIMDNNE